MTLALRYAARTHLGLGPKSRNEDSGYAGQHLLVLADGMGGHAAGDVASSMIVGALAPLDEEGLSAEQVLRVLSDELHEANAKLRKAMTEDPELAGMGSTMIAMVRAGSKLAMAHIGDSRAYLVREGELTQITKDHSFVQQLIDEHRITESEALHHPQRSLVTRVMTGNPDDEPDLSMRELRLGDRYLLCSDGLTDFVSPDVVAEVVTGSPTPEEAADRCIQVAVKASARDNITVVVADVVDDTDAGAGTVPEVVGAAAVRNAGRSRTRAMPVSPAEKAAALHREATGAPVEELPPLAEHRTSPRVLWLRWSGLAVAAAVVIVGGGYAGYDWTQRQYFIGEDGGYVAVYQGVNQTLGPIHLGTVLARSDILLTDLPAHYQDLVRGTIQIGSREDADSRVTALRATAADCRSQNATGIPCGTTLPVSTATTTGGLPDTSAGSPGATTAPTVTVTVTGADGIPSVVGVPGLQPPPRSGPAT
jgi:protein phosphatase